MRAARVALACAWLVVALSQPGEAAERTVRLGGIEATVWSPPADTPGPWPVVVVSHGIRLCSTQSRFLTEALAAAGYLVVAPNHDDAKCGDLDSSPPSANQLGMKPSSHCRHIRCSSAAARVCAS